MSSISHYYIYVCVLTKISISTKTVGQAHVTNPDGAASIFSMVTPTQSGVAVTMVIFEFRGGTGIHPFVKFIRVEFLVRRFESFTYVIFCAVHFI